MPTRFPPGYSFSAEYEVTREHCTAHVPGLPPMLATPALVLLIEATGVKAMAPYQEPDEGSVGLGVYISHLAPTPLGDRVRITLSLLEEKGRKVIWEVSAADSREKISEGRHERYFILIDKFKAGLEKKMAGSQA